MSGLESLGVIANIFGVINFGIQLASICKNIYDGESTQQDVLEECASSMSKAVAKVATDSSSLQPQDSSERDIADMAQKCSDAAKELLSEVQSITGSYRNRSVTSALKGTAKSVLGKRRVEELEKRLQAYRTTLETSVTVHFFTKYNRFEDFQRHSIDKLSKDLQSFISQLAAGQTRIEDLIQTNSDIVRKIELQQINNSLIPSVRETQQSEAPTEVQRQHFLQSFKFSEMNQRFNNILDPEDACFTRVFARYTALKANDSILREMFAVGRGHSKSLSKRKSPMHKDYADSDEKYQDPTDLLWLDFARWLASDERLFWIQGKPGSGKSTLARFLISNPFTQELLKRWRASSTVLWHFFWRIGTRQQSGLKGFCCTIIYQALHCVPDKSFVDKAIYEHAEKGSKDGVHDWSLSKLKQLLIWVLRNHPKPLALFVDGLDEIHEEGGPCAILELVGQIQAISHIKLCVSSRAERPFYQQFRNAPTLKLHELTAKDMQKFLHQEVYPYQERGLISAELEHRVVNLLLHKAQGVFLWLRLAVRTVKSGIMNEDGHTDLLSRIKQLPSELEELYTDMWRRSFDDEPIYRAQAAQYFNIVLDMRRLSEHKVSVLWMALAKSPETCAALLDVEAEGHIDGDQLDLICERTRKDISVRCFGLLEIEPKADWEENFGARALKSDRYKTIHNARFSEPRFIHRTVVDFLMKSEVGQSSLSADPVSSVQREQNLLKAFLCTSRTTALAYTPESPMNKNAQDIIPWLTLLRNSRKSHNLLDLTLKLYERDIMFTGLNSTKGAPKVSLLSLIARFPAFTDFVIQEVSLQPEQDMATKVLRDMWCWSTTQWPLSGELEYLIAHLRDTGANVLSPAMSSSPVLREYDSLVAYGSPLSLFLGVALNVFSKSPVLMDLKSTEDDKSIAGTILKLTTSLTRGCSSLEQGSHRSLHFTFWGEPVLQIHGAQSLNQIYRESSIPCDWFSRNYKAYTTILDTDLDFFASYIFDLATAIAEGNDQLLSDLYRNTPERLPIVRCILVWSPYSEIKCYRPLQQAPMSLLIARLLPGIRGALPDADIKGDFPGSMDFLYDTSVCEEVNHDTFMSKLSKERKGFLTLEDAGISPPNQDGSN